MLTLKRKPTKKKKKKKTPKGKMKSTYPICPFMMYYKMLNETKFFYMYIKRLLEKMKSQRAIGEEQATVKINHLPTTVVKVTSLTEATS